MEGVYFTPARCGAPSGSRPKEAPLEATLALRQFVPQAKLLRLITLHFLNERHFHGDGATLSSINQQEVLLSKNVTLLHTIVIRD